MGTTLKIYENSSHSRLEEPSGQQVDSGSHRTPDQLASLRLVPHGLFDTNNPSVTIVTTQLTIDTGLSKFNLIIRDPTLALSDRTNNIVQLTMQPPTVHNSPELPQIHSYRAR